MKKVSIKTIFNIGIVVLLFLTLIMGVILISIQKTLPDNKITYDDSPIRYDIDVRSELSVGLQKYFNNNGLAGLINNTNNLAATVLEGFGKARVPSDKVKSLSKLLSSALVSFEGFNYIFYQTENGKFVLDESGEKIIKEDVDPNEIYAEILKFPHIFTALEESTGITVNEIVKSLYYGIESSSEGQTKEIITEIGVNNFSAVVLLTMQLPTALNQALSPTANPMLARNVQGMIYEMGGIYLNVLDIVGIERLNQMLEYKKNKEDVKNIYELVLIDMMPSIQKCLPFLMYMMSHSMMSIPQNSYEAFQRSNKYLLEGTKESELLSGKNLLFGTIGLAKGLSNGIKNTEKDINISMIDFAKHFPTLLAYMQILNDINLKGITTTQYEDYKNEKLHGYQSKHFSELSSFFINFQLISMFFAKVQSVADIDNLSDDVFMRSFEQAKEMLNYTQAMINFTKNTLDSGMLVLIKLFIQQL